MVIKRLVILVLVLVLVFGCGGYNEEEHIKQYHWGMNIPCHKDSFNKCINEDYGLDLRHTPLFKDNETEVELISISKKDGKTYYYLDAKLFYKIELGDIYLPEEANLNCMMLVDQEIYGLKRVYRLLFSTDFLIKESTLQEIIDSKGARMQVTGKRFPHEINITSEMKEKIKKAIQ